MKIAISSTGPTLDAEIDERFGRCRYFIIIDPDTFSFEVLENTGSQTGGGAGVATAQILTDRDIEVVLTGSCGPNAFEVLAAAGIKVVTGVSGIVQSAVKDYLTENLQGASHPDVPGHHGEGSCLEPQNSKRTGGITMPKGDGTGPPTASIPRGGRQGGTRAGAGPSGNCVCPRCGNKVPHRQGLPCYSIDCPECGNKMARE